MRVSMNLLKLIISELYDLTAYDVFLWVCFLAIGFCGPRYLGWFGFFLVPVVIAILITALDIHWIFQDMREHPENGRDANFVFWFGVLCRIILLNGVLLPFSIIGLRLKLRGRDRQRGTDHRLTKRWS